MILVWCAVVSYGSCASICLGCFENGVAFANIDVESQRLCDGYKMIGPPNIRAIDRKYVNER